MTRSLWLSVVLLSPALACHRPQAGDPCQQTGFLCQDKTTALECRSTAWVGLPCRGPGGCVQGSGQVTCDMSLDLAGDACASTVIGSGLCTPAGTATLECLLPGILQQTHVCSTCTTSNGQVHCQP